MLFRSSKLRNSGVDSGVLRLALLSGHYRSDREWSDGLLKASEGRMNLWRAAISNPYGGDVRTLIKKLLDSLSNDLDTPTAFALIDEWANSRVKQLHADGRELNSIDEIGQLTRFIDAVFGIAL